MDFEYLFKNIINYSTSDNYDNNYSLSLATTCLIYLKATVFRLRKISLAIIIAILLIRATHIIRIFFPYVKSDAFRY